MKTCLTIAGSDSSGGAGIQADLKTFTVLGTYGMSVITALTAQNTQGVRAVELVPDEMVRHQLEAVLEDIPPDAIKIGMLGSAGQVRVIADVLAPVADTIPIVLDPVMVATSGAVLAESETVQAMIKWLFPLATLITPNLSETEVLTGKSIRSAAAMEDAARTLHANGVRAVLVKGGHLEAEDCLIEGTTLTWFRRPLVANPNTHGTGCTLSSAIAAGLAQGLPLAKAMEQGKEYVYRAILADLRLGKGRGPLNHMWCSTENEDGAF